MTPFFDSKVDKQNKRQKAAISREKNLSLPRLALALALQKSARVLHQFLASEIASILHQFLASENASAFPFFFFCLVKFLERL